MIKGIIGLARTIFASSGAKKGMKAQAQHCVNKVLTMPKKRKCNVLLSKIKSSDMSEYKDYGFGLPKDAKKFSVVELGDKSDKSFKRRIISFFDKNDKIIQRIDYGTHEGLTIKNYKNEINYDGGVTRNIEQYWLPSRKYCHVIEGENRLSFSSDYKIKEEFQCSENRMIHLKKGVEFRDTELRRIVRNYTKDRRLPKDVAVETYTKIGSEPIIKDRASFVITEGEHKIPVASDVQSTNNSRGFREAVVNDKFIAMRYLNQEQRTRALTAYYIEQKGLSDIGIHYGIFPHACSSSSAGHFSPAFGMGEIAYKDVPSVDTIAHEVEHAYQHSLIGRLGVGTNDYEKACAEKLGALRAEDVEIAKQYKHANDIYPNLTQHPELGKSKEYLDNLLEVDARKAGAQAQQEYNKNYIPFMFNYRHYF